MGQHKHNPTAIAAKEGRIKPRACNPQRAAYEAALNAACKIAMNEETEKDVQNPFLVALGCGNSHNAVDQKKFLRKLQKRLEQEKYGPASS